MFSLESVPYNNLVLELMLLDYYRFKDMRFFFNEPEIWFIFCFFLQYFLVGLDSDLKNVSHVSSKKDDDRYN